MYCEHIEKALKSNDVKVDTQVRVCPECVSRGDTDTWVHLRVCTTCGHIGCCDWSKNKHATKHYHTTGHPVMASFEPNEDWLWCFIDKEMHYPETK